MIDKCRLCGSGELRLQVDLGEHPLANAYIGPDREDARREVAYPLRLVACEGCGHPQIDVTVEPSVLFAEYAYVSGTSQTLKNHFKTLAAEVLHFWRNQTYEYNPRHARILDIAANDGTLVQTFNACGNCTAIGMDPAKNIVDRVRRRNVPVIHGYWPQDIGKLKGLKADIITACNVLAHVDEPMPFVAAALDSLNEGGVLVLEFPYALDTFLHNEWDQIYHEHLSYFLMHPLLTALNKLNASVVHATRSPIHGGSIRLFVQRLFPDKAYHCTLVGSDLIAREGESGLRNPEDWGDRFREKVGEVGRALGAKLNLLRDQGYAIVAYGASAKGNTVLNTFCDLRLEYIVDDSSYKWGLLTPGRHIPIVSPEHIKADNRNLAVLLLAWNFGKEITERIRGWRGERDRWVTYVPQVADGQMGEFQGL